MDVNLPTSANRIASVDLLRGVVIILMALDHVRMYFGRGTWYAEPTNLATTTPLLFFTRWITHFCAPVFVFLAGTAAFLYSTRTGATRKRTAGFLLTRGLWLVFVELVIVSFAWTFDITYSFLILQVIWAIGLSMVALSALVFLPRSLILAIGAALVLGHNLLDPITVRGDALTDILWYILHQPGSVFVDSTRVNFVYPVLPWIGLMAIGYVFGDLYTTEYSSEQRKRVLLGVGVSATLLFVVLRGFNLYGEPHNLQAQSSAVFSLMSFLNTTKYPPSLHFLLMTMGPALVFLGLVEPVTSHLAKPVIVFGRVPFFFYLVHLYLIHALAMLLLVLQGRDWSEYILSAQAISSGSLSSFGLGLGAVYLIWALVVILLYPLCRGYQDYRQAHPSHWWLRYL